MKKWWMCLCLVALVSCNSSQPTVIPATIPAARSTAENSHFGRQDAVVASGAILPAKKAQLSITVSGRIQSIAVEVGDALQPGAALISLEAGLLEADVVQARAALDSAQAQLAAAQAGARPEDLAAAEGAVLAAQGNVSAAAAALTLVESDCSLAVQAAETVLTQAQGALDAANAGLAQAQAGHSVLQSGARPEEIALYQAQLAQAQALLWHPTTVHDQLIKKDIGGVPEEEARYQMIAAQSARDAARAQLDLVQAGPTTDELAASVAQVSAAQAQVAIAQADKSAAEVALARAQAATANVDVARSQLEAAQGLLVQAEAQRDRLQAGATEEELAQLDSLVAQAESALLKVQTLLDQATLRAPFAGSVTNIQANVGETVLPGQVVLTIADLNSLQVETDDLSERDIEQVKIGQFAVVYVQALGVEVDGQVVNIDPQAGTIGGDVVYKVVIMLDQPPAGILWGMSVDVEIVTE